MRKCSCEGGDRQPFNKTHVKIRPLESNDTTHSIQNAKTQGFRLKGSLGGADVDITQMIAHPHHSMDISITHEPPSGIRHVTMPWQRACRSADNLPAARSTCATRTRSARSPELRRPGLQWRRKAGHRIEPCCRNSTRVPLPHDRQQSERRVTELLVGTSPLP